MRIGCPFADVGAHFASSQISVSSSLLTGVSLNVFGSPSVGEQDRPALGAEPAERGSLGHACHASILGVICPSRSAKAVVVSRELVVSEDFRTVRTGKQ